MEDDILKKFEIYLDEKYTSDEERNTQKAYLSDIRLFLKYFEGEFGEKLVSFSRGHILEYKNYMLNKKNYKFSTINRKLASISVYEDFLIENNIKESKDIKKRDSYKIDLPYISADMLPRKTIKKLRLEASKWNKRDFAIIVLIDEAGLKGYHIGGAEVSNKHAGFIINKGNATAKDILELIEYVKHEVEEKFNKKIELEIEIMGEN